MEERKHSVILLGVKRIPVKNRDMNVTKAKDVMYF